MKNSELEQKKGRKFQLDVRRNFLSILAVASATGLFVTIHVPLKTNKVGKMLVWQFSTFQMYP